ncbi:molybdopterin molybdotransferase MoeA [Sphingobacterium mizutaii]|uniref:molybdopterin molybdotransferase MoeA n=1 Tax=Sphingobacterium mizutaii TaxID=1010 RepID=UPI001BE4C29F|nr:molybdopterin molybdotransferase MoeA [Sphingobacterium mizutaii]
MLFINQWQQLEDKMEMITVAQAEQIILSEKRDFGVESILLQDALGRVLAEDLIADRDLPPFDRATVDGIAINAKALSAGVQKFKIQAVQAAGEHPISIASIDSCIEIMTGAALDPSMDSIIRYEDVSIENGYAVINIEVKKGQNIHVKAKDKAQGEVLVLAEKIIEAAIMGIAASIGKTEVLVKKLPRIAIISTGDEMVSIESVPNPYQLRRSNGISIQSTLKKYQISADAYHLNDHFDEIKAKLAEFLVHYDVLVMTGGVSMGKYDFLPKVCSELGVTQLFHKIKQRPGKPFWFGKDKNDKLLFAFPGNPVSVFMCLNRYLIPWLEASLNIEASSPQFAILQNDIQFSTALQYFAQVKLKVNNLGQLTAESVNSNGSGDFSHLAETNAFIELPLEKNSFNKGEVYQVWTYK